MADVGTPFAVGVAAAAAAAINATFLGTLGNMAIYENNGNL